ncbi:MAG: DUF192 domain-containing protein [Halobacteriaceae archaeon]
MRRRLAISALALALAVLVAASAAVAFLPATLFTAGAPYDEATVTVVDESGTTLGTVDARVADTRGERYTGLSNTSSLPPDAGMLFVFPEEDRRAFVMRRMDFPLDMLFVAGNGTITAVHSAPVPPPGTSEGTLTRYTGRAQYVLEVNRGWAAAHDVSPGDGVRITHT